MQNVSKLKHQERQQMLGFLREEAEKTRKHKKQMTKLYLKMMIPQHSDNFEVHFNQESEI